MRSIKVIAPAKVNLFLGIGPVAEDGYHRATSVMHALALHDTIQLTHIAEGEEILLTEPGDAAQPLRELTIKVEAENGLVVDANMVWAAGLDLIEVPDESNLACRAIYALAQALGRTESEHIRLVIEKQIPHQTGLGGGSADAAAALVGAAELWSVKDSHIVEQVAQQLGADVAFFLYGGCVLLEGRGDEFVRSLQPRKDAVVLVKPEGGVSTAQAYATFDTNPSGVDDALVAQVYRAQAATDIPLFNNLALASEQLHEQLAPVRAFLEAQTGVEGVLLCGSGAGTFAICRDYATSQRIAALAQAKGWWVRITSFSSIGAALLP